ncbi:MAG: epimerase [Cytophagaceae bacterium BCCC1]|nr:MAG: epimerase [Cytophagaceae bacterium BCCC1]
MVVLITGATGLVGSAVAKEFLSLGFTVKALIRSESSKSAVRAVSDQIEIVEGDILDIISLDEALQGVDYVVHAAAVVSFSPKERANMYKINIEGTANVVNACLASNIKKLCFISSVAAFGRPAQTLISSGEKITIDEKQKWESSDTNSHYAITKYMAECEVWRGQAEGLSTVIVNPSIVLGEGDWSKSSTQLFKYVFNEKPFYTKGFINYVDVQDLSIIIKTLLLSEIENERFCVSSGLISYKEFFEKIANSFGKKSPSFEVKPWMIDYLWRFEALKSWITGNAPLITKETAKTSRLQVFYNSNKLKKAIEFEFRPLATTLKRVCDYLVSKS